MANIRIILVEPQYPGNIGASARAMFTAGIRDLVLVRPMPFRESEEARNFASGARDLLAAATVVESLDAATEGLHWLVGTTNRRRGGVLDQPIPVRQAAKRIAALARNQRVGILFGREDFGISSDDLARCNLAAAIPVARGCPPLNLSHAVQVVAQEVLVASFEGLEPEPAALAAISEVEALLQRFGELLELLGPDAIHRPTPQVLDSLRRIFSRSGLEPRDVRTLHMVVRGALWKMNR